MICTLFNPSSKLHQDASLPYPKISTSPSLVGRLVYLNATILDIKFCTQQLSKLLFSPTMNHFHALTRVQRFLRTCPIHDIFLLRDSQIKLQGYSDADWASCLDLRRWISGKFFFLRKSLIFCRKKKQYLGLHLNQNIRHLSSHLWASMVVLLV